MPGIFDGKLFNAEVFQGYVDRIPDTKRMELIKSRAIRPRPDLANAMREQTGGNFITTQLKGLIYGSVPVNYDGETNITANRTKTFSHDRVVVGRANAWVEDDFSYDITGGEDFLENVAQQVANYWYDIDQATIVSILKGIFNMADDAGAAFVNAHTTDVTAVTNTEGAVGKMDGTTLNNAIQKACGDNKGKFTLAFMHSVVATNLENLKLLVYMKYNDANGIERDLSLATLNGRLVAIDDSMPVIEVEATAGVYKVKIAGTYAKDDTVTVAGHTHTVEEGGTAVATIASAITAMFGDSDNYTASSSGGTITLTEKEGAYGTGKPAASNVSTSGTVTVTVDTEPIPADRTEYVTFVLGDGAIEYTNCGVKVPSEVYRDPKTNGGQDTLYSRQRKCFAPYGISFTKSSMAKLSPTDEELETGTNWKLVNTMDESGTLYIDHKAIPIARIISLG